MSLLRPQGACMRMPVGWSDLFGRRLVLFMVVLRGFYRHAPRREEPSGSQKGNSCRVVEAPTTRAIRESGAGVVHSARGTRVRPGSKGGKRRFMGWSEGETGTTRRRVRRKSKVMTTWVKTVAKPEQETGEKGS